MEKFPEITVRLENTGPAAALNPFLYLRDETLQKRSQQEDAKNLQDLQKNVVTNHAILLSLPQLRETISGDGETKFPHKWREVGRLFFMA
jgi:hypothetical protein